MKFAVDRETLIKPLQSLVSVVEKRHTMAILGNILFKLAGHQLILTTTDLEVELSASITLEKSYNESTITVPARKLYDIMRSLPEGSEITFAQDKNRFIVSSGHSRFTLSMLDAADFPSVDGKMGDIQVQIPQSTFASLLKRTYFAMAQQDVCYFLNGMLFGVTDKTLRVVATDGHRLAMSTEPLPASVKSKAQVIIPRKAILELVRLVNEQSDELVTLALGSHHIQVTLPNYQFISKLLDGRYPDYNRVVPTPGSNLMVANKEQLRCALQRTAILSNEKYRGVRLIFNDTTLRLLANNPEQEEAQDEINVTYEGQQLEIGFNVSYLLDVLNAIGGDEVKIALNNSNSSALIHDANSQASIYVVMPIRL